MLCTHIFASCSLAQRGFLLAAKATAPSILHLSLGAAPKRPPYTMIKFILMVNKQGQTRLSVRFVPRPARALLQTRRRHPHPFFFPLKTELL